MSTGFLSRKTVTVLGFLLAFIFAFAAAVTAAGQTALFYIGSREYIVDGVHYAMDAAPYIKDGRTFVPVRYAAQITGVGPENILYANGKVTLVKGDKVVQFTIGSKVMLKNGTPITMDAAPEITNGRTMLPFRWIGQALDTQVEWYPVNQMVVIRTDNQVGSQTSIQQPVTQPVIQVPQMEAPTGLRADIVPSGSAGFQVTFSWNPVSGATRYNLYVSRWNQAQNSWDPFSALSQVQTNSVTFDTSGYAITAGSLYQFYVTAVGNGESLPSEKIGVNLESNNSSQTPNADVVTLTPLSFIVPSETNTYTWNYEGQQFSWTISVPIWLIQDEAFNKVPKLAHPSILKVIFAPWSVSRQVELDTLVKDRDSAQYISWVASELNKIALSQGYDRFHQAEFVARFVQSIPYRIVNDNIEFPPQAIANGGNCINKSVLLVSILRQLGYPVAVLIFTNPSHAVAGIGLYSNEIPKERTGLTRYAYNGTDYYFTESTTPSNIGVSWLPNLVSVIYPIQ